MKKLWIFRHESWIGAPHIIDLLTRLEVAYTLKKIDERDPVPSELDADVAGLIFLGGTMSVNDTFPWIDAELNLIQLAYDRHLPVLGHCFGAQLICKALGGEVRPMSEKEIGWHPIKFTDNKTTLEWKGYLPDDMRILLWHHDAFSSIPKAATPLYTTLYCSNQAFVIDNIVAIIAHIELNESMLQEWLNIYGHDITPNQGSVQSIHEIRQNIKTKIQEMHTLSDSFYLKWLLMVYPPKEHPHFYHKVIRYLKTGSCLCGAVRFYLKDLRDVVNCHCRACRKFHGHYAAYTKVDIDNLYIFGEKHLNWFQAPEHKARRGWCQKCGSSLFWQKDPHDGMCVAAGSLDHPTHLETLKNIYTDDASDYYEIHHQLECYSGSMNL